MSLPPRARYALYGEASGYSAFVHDVLRTQLHPWQETIMRFMNKEYQITAEPIHAPQPPPPPVGVMLRLGAREASTLLKFLNNGFWPANRRLDPPADANEQCTTLCAIARAIAAADVVPLQH